MGRPIKLTKELEKKITDVIRAGNYIETAAAFAGIHKSTLYDWLKRGEREKQRVHGTNRKISNKEQPFVDFSDAVEKALAEAEIRDVMRISEASKTDWKAAAWRLERKFPDKWGRKTIHLVNKEEQTLKLEKMRLDIDKTQAEIEKLEKETKTTQTEINILDEWSGENE